MSRGPGMLLVKFRGPARERLRTLPAGARVFRALAGDESYAYVDDGDAAALERALPDASIVRLSPLADLPGASAGADAPYHYVVETDVAPAHEDDFNAWYDREHLPGLAAVPGTVRARRLRDAAGHPRYYACYDLVSPETLGSPPWLAVRATPWSDRVRPTFRNTKRTMFERV